MTTTIREVRVLTTDGRLRSLAPEPGATPREVVDRTIEGAGLDWREVAKAQGWSDPSPAAPTSAQRAGCVYSWQPADLAAAAAAYRSAGLELDDLLPSGCM